MKEPILIIQISLRRIKILEIAINGYDWISCKIFGIGRWAARHLFCIEANRDFVTLEILFLRVIEWESRTWKEIEANNRKAEERDIAEIRKRDES